ncbi:YoaK family protein [Kitasatospora sp. NPDC008050]|uniref:YoaK family protein n=1 Tax=Kitasatospora sp. NPDC008050 TaxID=3364021 RepID=UPI0036F05813
MRVAPGRGQVLIAVVMFALTMVAGSIDAITFLGLGHVFAALATGNVLLLGFGVGGTTGTPIARPAEALGAFVAGVVLAHVLITYRLGRSRRWFLATLGGEVALLAGTGAYVLAGNGDARLPLHGASLTVLLLAVTMGWHSRVVDEARIPDMPTTVLQTSLVKAIADLLPFRPSAQATATTPDAPDAPRLTRMRRMATVAGIFLGGLGGALLHRLGVGPALLGVAGFEAAVAVLYSRTPRLGPAGSGDPETAG